MSEISTNSAPDSHPALDEQEKKALHERLAEERRVLNTMENWGATLFLGGIGLVCKQLIDWGYMANPSCSLPWQIYLAPALLGLTAFIFLRVVNQRICDVRDRQYANRHGTTGKGSVGWSMALMPLIFGNVGTWYFTLTKPQAEPYWFAIVLASALAVIGGWSLTIRPKQPCCRCACTRDDCPRTCRPADPHPPTESISA